MYAFVFLALLAMSQISNSTERAIVTAVDAGEAEALALLEKLGAKNNHKCVSC